MLMGIGGTPEGVISAAAIKCHGGALQGRLWPRNDDERAALVDAGFDVDKVLTHDDLVRATTSSSPRPASRAGRSCAACASAPRGSRRSRS